MVRIDHYEVRKLAPAEHRYNTGALLAHAVLAVTRNAANATGTGEDQDQVGRATQAVDYGRRRSGYVFGAFQPATGEAVNACHGGRTIANWVAFLEVVDATIDAEIPRIYATLGNLSTHRAADVSALATAASPLGIRLPARGGRLSESDRTVVEDAAQTGPPEPPLRNLGRDHDGDRPGDKLLERPSPSVRLGSPEAASPHRRPGIASLSTVDLEQMTKCKWTFPHWRRPCFFLRYFPA